MCVIRQLFSTPTHAQSNGQAENCVKTFKLALKKAFMESQNTDEFLAKFLFDYPNTPHSVTGVSPAQLMFNRKLRPKLDLLIPNKKRIIETKVEKQSEQFGGSDQKFNVGENVYFRNFSNLDNAMWSKSEIVGQEWSAIFRVKDDKGGECRFESAKKIDCLSIGEFRTITHRENE